MSGNIYFAGSRGGAGGTTCAVGVGLALARGGDRVLIVDGDKDMPAALLAAGCAGLQTYTLEEARQGACRVKQALVEHPRSPNLFILPCAGCADEQFVQRAAKETAPLFDYVLCDGAAAGACEQAAVVCEPYPASIKGADICINKLRDGGMKDVGVIVNKVNGGLLREGRIMTPADIAALLRAELWGVIPEDLDMPLGTMRQDSAKAFRMTAARISRGAKKIYSPYAGYAGPGGYIKRKMRSRI